MTPISTATASRLVQDARSSIRSLAVTDELQWRWQDADAEMEPPSNFGAMVNMLQMGGPMRTGKVCEGVSDVNLAAAAKAWDIDRALESVPVRLRATLWALYCSPEGREDVLLQSVTFARATHATRVEQGGASPDIAVWFRALERAAEVKPLARDMLSQIRRAVCRQAVEACASYAGARRFRRLMPQGGNP